jgi:hypothetical protein
LVGFLAITPMPTMPMPTRIRSYVIETIVDPGAGADA